MSLGLLFPGFLEFPLFLVSLLSPPSLTSKEPGVLLRYTTTIAPFSTPSWIERWMQTLCRIYCQLFIRSLSGLTAFIPFIHTITTTTIPLRTVCSLAVYPGRDLLLSLTICLERERINMATQELTQHALFARGHPGSKPILLPEDHHLRGLLWTHSHHPRDWFDHSSEDDNRVEQTDAAHKLRSEEREAPEESSHG